MKSIKLIRILCLTTSVTLSVSAQDDAINLDALFEDDFEEQSTVTINDPIEKFNRVIFGFNDGFYNVVARPVSKTYAKVMPDRIERGLGNFFRNLKFPSRFAGNVLQGRFGEAGKETGKFALNSTVGLGGLFRPSDEWENLQTNTEDVGQAFGNWGIGHGFYVVMPFMGPTSLRDLVGDYADGAVEPIQNPWSQVDDNGTRRLLRATEIINRMPALVKLYDSMQNSAIDPYSSTRDAYTQQRAREVAR